MCCGQRAYGCLLQPILGYNLIMSYLFVFCFSCLFVFVFSLWSESGGLPARAHSRSRPHPVFGSASLVILLKLLLNTYVTQLCLVVLLYKCYTIAFHCFACFTNYWIAFLVQVISLANLFASYCDYRIFLSLSFIRKLLFLKKKRYCIRR